MLLDYRNINRFIHKSLHHLLTIHLKLQFDIYLDVSQCTPQDTQVGGFLLVDVWDVFLERFEALLQVRPSVRPG